MPPITIAEVASTTWQLQPTLSHHVDRAGTMTVADYLRSRDVVWTNEPARADVLLYKAAATGANLGALLRGAAGLRPFAKKSLAIIGEPREMAPLAYLAASPRNTLAVAPGSTLKRLYFGSVWSDPRLEDWSKRLDRFCWIARPTPERVALARAIIAQGVALDVFSRDPWPLPCWRGYADNELETGRRYRYRIACENFFTHGYHSEKLFCGIRSGCVTFYKSDPALRLPFVSDAYVPFSEQNVREYARFGPAVVQGMAAFMFSRRWEVYSFRAFYDRLIEVARGVLAS